MKSSNKLNSDKLVIYSLITLGIISRLIPHPANFVPLGALALFSGTYLSKKTSLLIPLSAMFISDIFLGFHKTMPFVYGSFILIALLGRLLQNRVSPKNVLTTTLFGSIIFFLITNFGVWLQSYNGVYAYPHTWQGLIQCYTMAIPFFRISLTADLIYSTAFFGAYEYIKLSQNKKSAELTAHANS
jgi:uncharacterized membrane protein